MAQRGHTEDGQIVCSACSGFIDATATVCVLCNEELADDFDAMVCPYCNSVLKRGVPECVNCGLKFKAERKVSVRSKEDDEFLSRLLEWGKKKMADEVRSEVRIEGETETSATETFRALLGSSASSELEKESILELQKDAEIMSEFEKREESILKLAQPLRYALKSRHESLDLAENEIRAIQKELGNMHDMSQPEAVEKRSELEKRMAEISVERDEIKSLEENIRNMDETYRRLLESHQLELAAKEENMQARLEAFKNEREKRDKQMQRLKTREEFLHKKEEELKARIESLKSREQSLKKTEEEMKKTIQALQDEKESLEIMRKQSEKMVTREGMWAVPEDELKKIMKKNKKMRSEWLISQAEIQGELSSGKKPRDIEQDMEEEFARREGELAQRISELEARLKEVQTEESSVKKEEDALSDIEEDIKKVLKVVDDLLGHLPEDLIEKFANSDDFKLYEKVMDELGL